MRAHRLCNFAGVCGRAVAFVRFVRGERLMLSAKLKPEDLDNEVLIADIEAVPTVRRTDTDLRRIRQNSNSVDAGTSAGAAEETTHGEPTDAH